MTTFLLTHGKKELSAIAILVSFRGVKYRKCIGESIAVKTWNARTKRVRVTTTNPEAQIVNDRLDAWQKAGERTVDHFKEFKATPTREEFLSYLEAERWGKHDLDTTLLVPYFDKFIARYEGVRSKSQLAHYKVCKKTMAEYEAHIGKPLRFDDIDMDFYNRFTSWFYQKGMTRNYLGEKIKILKVVLNDAREIDKLHTNGAYLVKGFETPQEETDSIYLTEDELMAIYHVEPTAESIRPLMKNEDIRPQNIEKKLAAMRKARDMFLVGAFTGLRYSDYSRIRPQNVKDGLIRIRNKKTGIVTAVPVHWVVAEIFARGYDFDKPLQEQKLNFHIKEVAFLAGITEEVVVSKSIGGHLVERVYKKYELVSSHTARRSFATNAYKAGIPPIAIMKITGHKRETTFMRYIRISDKENAEMLKSAGFFQPRSFEPSVEPNVEPNTQTDG